MREEVSQIIILANTSSMNEKQKLIKEFSENDKFVNLLYYALNPMLTYKVSEKTLMNKVITDQLYDTDMRDIESVCEFLASRKALDDATVNQVCVFLQSIDDAIDREVYTKIIAKTLKLGVTAKTVNKVIPNLIPEWEVQQAYPIEKHPIKDGEWFALTQKLNGVRATYYNGQLISRTGLPYEGLDHITSFINNVFGNDYVFDGELTLVDTRGLSDNEAFRTATGIINSDSKQKLEIGYTIFDAVLPEEFIKGNGVTYGERRRFLNAISHIMFAESAYVSILPLLYEGKEQSKIDELLEKMVREDKEGLMLNLDVPYKRKRHSGILKVKRFYTMDLPIIRCEEGTGKYAGMLGAVMVDYKGNEVGVGSGFTDEQRIEYWKNPEQLIGCLCEVKYKEISTNKNTGAESLQFPVFITLRTDKGEVSYG